MIEMISLRQAMEERTLVRFARRFERGCIRGYVLDIGPRFFLVGLVNDRIRPDGFECFRIRDVRFLTADPTATFVELALKKRGYRPPKKPDVNLERTAAILESAGRDFPLLAIHRERAEPGVGSIGRVVGIRRGRAHLLEINPDATWNSQPTRYPLKEITRVSFGGDYEDALHLVAGPPEWDECE